MAVTVPIMTRREACTSSAVRELCAAMRSAAAWAVIGHGER
jgi:hypothetical protein